MQHFYHDKKLGQVEFQISRQQQAHKPLDKNEIYPLLPEKPDGTCILQGGDYDALRQEIADDININEGFVKVHKRGRDVWVKLGPQEPAQDERIFNRRLPDGTRRPISEFFDKAAEGV